MLGPGHCNHPPAVGEMKLANLKADFLTWHIPTLSHKINMLLFVCPTFVYCCLFVLFVLLFGLCVGIATIYILTL